MTFYKSDAKIQALKDITRAQKDVLTLLTSFAERKGVAWPSYDLIMERCSIGSRTTVRKALKVLEDKRYITIKHGERDGARNKPNMYYIIRQEKSPTLQKTKQAPAIIMNSTVRNEIVGKEIREQITCLKACRNMLQKSGAMNIEIGVEMEKKLKVLTTELSKL